MRYTPTSRTNWQKHIDSLVKYVQEKGYKVEFYKYTASQAFFGRKIIRIRETCNVQNMYYILLHEIGHVLNYHSTGYHSKYRHVVRCHYNTVHYRMNRLEEEIAAWDKAEEITDTLHLPLNQVKFDKLKYLLLKDYVEWLMKIDQKGKRDLKDDAD